MIFLFRIVPLKLTDRNGNALRKMYEMLPKINEEVCTNSSIDIAKALLAEVTKINHLNNKLKLTPSELDSQIGRTHARTRTHTSFS